MRRPSDGFARYAALVLCTYAAFFVALGLLRGRFDNEITATAGFYTITLLIGVALGSRRNRRHR